MAYYNPTLAGSARIQAILDEPAPGSSAEKFGHHDSLSIITTREPFDRNMDAVTHRRDPNAIDNSNPNDQPHGWRKQVMLQFPPRRPGHVQRNPYAPSRLDVQTTQLRLHNKRQAEQLHDRSQRWLRAQDAQRREREREDAAKKGARVQSAQAKSKAGLPLTAEERFLLEEASYVRAQAVFEEEKAVIDRGNMCLAEIEEEERRAVKMARVAREARRERRAAAAAAAAAATKEARLEWMYTERGLRVLKEVYGMEIVEEGGGEDGYKDGYGEEEQIDNEASRMQLLQRRLAQPDISNRTPQSINGAGQYWWYIVFTAPLLLYVLIVRFRRLVSCPDGFHYCPCGLVKRPYRFLALNPALVVSPVALLVIRYWWEILVWVVGWASWGLQGAVAMGVVMVIWRSVGGSRREEGRRGRTGGGDGGF
ncbi:MAG: hypothetical protein Q9216_003567 [Gyalolechia sp. 2 TL-2023]